MIAFRQVCWRNGITSWPVDLIEPVLASGNVKQLGQESKSDKRAAFARPEKNKAVYARARVNFLSFSLSFWILCLFHSECSCNLRSLYPPRLEETQKSLETRSKFRLNSIFTARDRLNDVLAVGVSKNRERTLFVTGIVPLARFSIIPDSHDTLSSLNRITRRPTKSRFQSAYSLRHFRSSSLLLGSCTRKPYIVVCLSL